MELSKRLTAVAGLVTEGASVADIGKLRMKNNRSISKLLKIEFFL